MKQEELVHIYALHPRSGHLERVEILENVIGISPNQRTVVQFRDTKVLCLNDHVIYRVPLFAWASDE